jgi:hypothetical protein
VLRADGWREVSKAVAGSPKQLSPSPWGRARYLIVDVRPCPECRYQVALDFEQDDNAQWHWVGLYYPERSSTQATETAKADETIALHIVGLQNLPKEPLELVLDYQGGSALLEVLGKEGRVDLGSRFPNDRCYYGAITAGFSATASNVATDALNDLAVDITVASLSAISLPSAGRDALYNFVLDVGSAYLKKEDLTVATARSVVERSLGYILPFLAENYPNKPPELLMASAQSLIREAVRKLIKQQGIVYGEHSGSNFNSPRSLGAAPKTSVTVKWYYSPKTHYLTAYLAAQCERSGGGFDNGFYLVRFQIIEGLGFGRHPDLGTVEIFSFGTR